VKKSIESWILAGLYNKRDAEKIADPIRELNTLLMREGRYYIKSYDFSRLLAEMIDLNKAMRNSHSYILCRKRECSIYVTRIGRRKSIYKS